MRNLGLMDPAFLGGLGGLSLYDPDAAAYIAAVEAADGQALETGVKDAINAFVLGCKTDSIWNAIKASCILAGARTLAGALVPLVGAAPTNFNFVAEDYNRKTGLVGDGSTKYLNSNRASNTQGVSNQHGSIFVSSLSSTLSVELGVNPTGLNGNDLLIANRVLNTLFRCGDGATYISPSAASTGFVGCSRASSASYSARHIGSTVTVTSATSASASALTFGIFTQNDNGAFVSFSNSRLAFYSIGQAIDLALLDARVTALVNALAVAIP
jgi:hypothetical protein